VWQSQNEPRAPVAARAHPTQAAVMALDEYLVDVVRLQRVADEMRQFLEIPAFSVRSLVGAY
jgi:hypothetical protein